MFDPTQAIVMQKDVVLLQSCEQGGKVLRRVINQPDCFKPQNRSPHPATSLQHRKKSCSDGTRRSGPRQPQECIHPPRGHCCSETPTAPLATDREQRLAADPKTSAPCQQVQPATLS